MMIVHFWSQGVNVGDWLLPGVSPYASTRTVELTVKRLETVMGVAACVCRK